MKTSAYTQLLLEIADADEDIAVLRSRLASFRQLVTETETALIGAKLKKSRAEEAVRVYNLTTVFPDMDEAKMEEDLVRFAAILPELLDRLKDE